MDEAAILDRDAHPCVRRPGQIRRKLGEAVFALGQDLKRVLLGLNHDLEHARDVLGRDRLVEEIARAVHEHDAR